MKKKNEGINFKWNYCTLRSKCNICFSFALYARNVKTTYFEVVNHCIVPSCVNICRQKVATIPDGLYVALNHTAQSILVLQIIVINRDLLGSVKRYRGNSIIIKRVLWLWAILPPLSLTKATHLALILLFWDRDSVIVPCFLTGSYFWIGKIQFGLHYWRAVERGKQQIPVKLFLNWLKSIIVFLLNIYTPLLLIWGIRYIWNVYFSSS